jgi:hypothetical protein
VVIGPAEDGGYLFKRNNSYFPKQKLGTDTVLKRQ